MSTELPSPEFVAFMATNPSPSEAQAWFNGRATKITSDIKSLYRDHPEETAEWVMEQVVRGQEPVDLWRNAAEWIRRQEATGEH